MGSFFIPSILSPSIFMGEKATQQKKTAYTFYNPFQPIGSGEIPT
jgi:hypothetical protein